jgi:predicted dehydrogenase
MLVRTSRLLSQTGGICPRGNGFPPSHIIYKISVFSAGPIVEQGTHFCDLSRYFGGEVDMSTVSAHSLEWDEKPGHLSKVPIDESKIAPVNRIPRATAATW